MRVCERCSSIYPQSTRFCGIDGQELAPFVQEPLIGQRVDRYLVQSLLGRGGCGSVYKAVHTELQTVFALKILFGNLGGDSRYVERFRREAQAVSKIRSPWVVSVVDFGTSSTGLTYLVMEYCTGAPLDQIIHKEKIIEPERAARFTAQIANALAVAHKVGLVHRDVKPANIVIEKNEGKEFAKLLDFGIVRLPDLEASEKLTQEGAVMGTPPYMSPEQASGSEVTAQSDLYSLGVVLYQMLSGKKPFIGSASQIFHQHHHQAPPPLSVTGPVADLAMTLLAKRPEDRPQSATAVAELAKRIEIDFRGGEPSFDTGGHPLMHTPSTGTNLAPVRSASAMTSSPSGGAPISHLATPTPSNPGTATGESPSVVDLSANMARAPNKRAVYVVFALALGLSVLAVVLMFTTPSYPPDEVPKQSAPADSLEVIEQRLDEVLKKRGLRRSDLALLAETSGTFRTWEDQRRADQTAAREALTRLVELARRALVTDDVVRAHLDQLDQSVAAQADRMPKEAFETLKVDYLDLYRQVQLAATSDEREVMLQAVARFEDRIVGP